MMKIFTIIFLIYYISNLFNRHEIISRNVGDFLKAHSEDKGFLLQTCKLLSLFLLLSIFGIAEMVYVIMATGYGNKVITIGVLIFYIINLVISYKKNKETNNKDEEAREYLNRFKNDIRKRTLISNISEVVMILYYIYMFSVLFL